MGTLGLCLESPQFIRNDESQKTRGRQPVLVAPMVPCALQGLHKGTAGVRERIKGEWKEELRFQHLLKYPLVVR